MTEVEIIRPKKPKKKKKEETDTQQPIGKPENAKEQLI